MQNAMIAEVAFAVYRTQSLEKNVRGEPIPAWHELDEDNRKAWIAAVASVRNVRLADLEDKPLVEAFDRLMLALGMPAITVDQGQLFEVALIDHAIEKLAERKGVAA